MGIILSEENLQFFVLGLKALQVFLLTLHEQAFRVVLATDISLDLLSDYGDFLVHLSHGHIDFSLETAEGILLVLCAPYIFFWYFFADLEQLLFKGSIFFDRLVFVALLLRLLPSFHCLVVFTFFLLGSGGYGGALGHFDLVCFFSLLIK